MAKPSIHAINSAKKFGGIPLDYVEIHDLMDSSKSAHATMKHRAVFHSAFGIYLVEKILGRTIINSDGKEIPTRSIAEQHVLEDLGRIPSLDEWLGEMKMKPWMCGMRYQLVEQVD